MTSTSLVVRDLSHRYPGADVDALDGLSLDVAAGERVAVLGPNGSGKTTFALHLPGLLDLQAGRIVVGTTPVAPEHLREVRRRVGLVFQDPDDQLFMTTVRDDVGFGPANLGVDRDDRRALVDDVLRSVGGLHLADRPPHHLSTGEKRRVAMAAVLAMRPELLVLDEPTSGLDPAGRRELADLLGGLDQTQVVVTHDLPFALATCPRAVVLSEGRIAVDAPTADLLADEDLLARFRLELPYGFVLRDDLLRRP